MSRAYTWTFFGGHLEKMHGTDLTLNCRPKNSLDLESAQNLALKKHRFKKMSMICPTLPILFYLGFTWGTSQQYGLPK